MVNIWNQYQCMITFCFSRSASFFESGVGRGMGFRDSNQDLVGFVHQVPSRARQRIIDIASTQFPDGGCYHQYQPLTKRGNNDIGGGFNDDPMWLIFSSGTMAQKFGGAISGSLTALLLGFAGLVSHQDMLTGETIVTITDEQSVRTMIWALFSLFPAVIAFIMAGLAYLLPLKK